MLQGLKSDLEYAIQYRAKISNLSKKLLELLLAGDKPAAMGFLNTISPAYDGSDDLNDTIQVLCDVLDTVLQQQESTFPRQLPPVSTFSLEQQDKLMADLLDMKVIYVSDLFNFSQNIREQGAIEKFEKVKQTQAYKVYQAIKNGPSEVLTLIQEYFTLFTNDKFRVEMSSRMLEDVLYNNTSKPEVKKAMAKALFGHGAQTQDIDALNDLDDTHELAELASKNEAHTKYRYLVG